MINLNGVQIPALHFGNGEICAKTYCNEDRMTIVFSYLSAPLGTGAHIPEEAREKAMPIFAMQFEGLKSLEVVRDWFVGSCNRWAEYIAAQEEKKGEAE